MTDISDNNVFAATYEAFAAKRHRRPISGNASLLKTFAGTYQAFSGDISRGEFQRMTYEIRLKLHLSPQILTFLVVIPQHCLITVNP